MVAVAAVVVAAAGAFASNIESAVVSDARFTELPVANEPPEERLNANHIVPTTAIIQAVCRSIRYCSDGGGLRFADDGVDAAAISLLRYRLIP
mmetsp:Transcript_12018/g.26013  ORF Transcript_12018/g.26013 Transcript_12018/m.26013 type:complete len:93 (-) Transcript_12018:303-581(-)